MQKLGNKRNGLFFMKYVQLSINGNVYCLDYLAQLIKKTSTIHHDEWIRGALCIVTKTKCTNKQMNPWVLKRTLIFIHTQNGWRATWQDRLVGPTVFCVKFCQILQASLQNSVAHGGLPFVGKLSSILFKNFRYWRLPLCSVMLATHRENYQYFFPFKSVICQVALCLLHTILTYCDSYW